MVTNFCKVVSNFKFIPKLEFKSQILLMLILYTDIIFYIAKGLNFPNRMEKICSFWR